MADNIIEAIDSDSYQWYESNMTDGTLPDYKAFKELSDDELRQKSDDALKVATQGLSVQMNTAYLLQAQLYMTELDRRANAVVSARDFNMANRSYKMERWVIILIGLELLIAAVSLWYGVHEGNKQQTVLEQMGTNTGNTAAILKTQGEILQTMNTNTHDTVTAVGELQSVQTDSLTAQKNSLRSIGQMNTALQKQLDLAFAVSVLVGADENKKRISIANQTKTAIYIWGAKYDNEPPVKFSDERFIGPGSQYEFFLDKLFENASLISPKGSPEKKVPFDFYLRSADGKPYIARSFLLEKWEGDIMKLYPTIISVKQEEWPANVK